MTRAYTVPAQRSLGKRALLAVLCLAWLAQPAWAGPDLVEIIPSLYGGDGIVLADPPNGHDARFTPPGDAQLNELSDSLSAGLGFFSAGTAVASFVFDPAQAIFVRAEDTLGPLVAERADTIGKGKINFGMTYSKLKFDEFDGDSLNDLELSFTHADTCSGTGGGLWFPGDNPRFCTPISQGGLLSETPPATGFGVPSPLNPGFERDTLLVSLDVELEQQIIALFANYGIFDNWEVGVVLPLVDTKLEVNAFARTTMPAFNGVHRFCNATGPAVNGNPAANPFDATLPNYVGNQSAGCSGIEGGNGGVVEARDLAVDRRKGQAFGIGDMVIRSKWHAVQADGWIPDVGILGRVKVPTGNEDELLGTGEADFSAFAVASAKYGWVSPHANLGFEVTTAGSEFHNFRYVVGADFRLHERVTLAGDIVGRKTFKDEIIGDSIVDGAVGMKINVIGTLNLLGNVLVPINKHEGLRPKVAWTVGWEATF